MNFQQLKGYFQLFLKPDLDGSMRGEITDVIWDSVITIYKDGEIIQEFTGNKNPRNTRVALIDDGGLIVFCNDSGFSVKALNELISPLKIK